jgi:maltose alpha-D-glucosyltransferase / alpha-amylase
VLDPWIQAWEVDASAVYLQGYFKQLGDRPLVPSGQSREALLRAFTIDKAFYELAYELGNRPDWVDIPLDGLLRQVQPHRGPERSAG